MTGHLPRHEMERLLETAWIQAVPMFYEESFGLVVAEAMMRGTAVVASNLGGPAEMIQNGRTGLLVPPEDETALTEALVYLLENREISEQIGEAGRKFALLNFDQERYLDKIVQIYQKMCIGRS